MITLVEGKLGAGKTYYVVHELLSRYFVWDNEKVQYVPRVLENDVFPLIYTNIDRFFLGGDLNEEVGKVGGWEIFFTRENIEKFTQYRKCIFVIDEVQLRFHYKFYNIKVFEVFEYARKLGLEFYLITQDVCKVTKGITSLAEHNIKTVRRSFRLKRGYFYYQFMSGYDILKRKALKVDKRIFTTFRSAFVDVEKVSTHTTKFYMYFLVFVILAVCGFGYFIKVRLMSSKGQKKQETKKVSSSPVPVPSKIYVGKTATKKIYKIGGKIVYE